MLAKDQETLFKNLKAAHPGWTPKFTSGYVHGASDEELRGMPARAMVLGAEDMDQYSLGYLTGFAMHRGTDVEIEKWFGFVGLLVEELRK
jgi:hypothetical protein